MGEFLKPVITSLDCFLLQVVADAGDCAILVKVWRCAARWNTDSSRTTRYLSKLSQVLCGKQI